MKTFNKLLQETEEAQQQELSDKEKQEAIRKKAEEIRQQLLDKQLEDEIKAKMGMIPKINADPVDLVAARAVSGGLSFGTAIATGGPIANAIKNTFGIAHDIPRTAALFSRDSLGAMGATVAGIAGAAVIGAAIAYASGSIFDWIRRRRAAGETQQKIDKAVNRAKILLRTDPKFRNHIQQRVRKKKLKETKEFLEDVAIANSIGNGGIAGARMGEDPPVRKKPTDNDYLANPDEVEDEVNDYDTIEEHYLQENPLWSSAKAEKKGKRLGQISALGAATVGTYYGHKADMVRKAYDVDPGFTGKVLADLHGWVMKSFGLDAPEATSVMNWVSGAGAGVLAAVGAYYTGKMIYWIRDMIKRGWSPKKANAAARVLQKKLQTDPKFAAKMKMKMRAKAHGVAESLILEAQAKNPKYKMDKSEVLKGTAWDSALVSGGHEAFQAVKGNELGNWRFALISAGVALMMHSTRDFLIRHKRVHEKAVRALEQAAKKLRKDMEFRKQVEELVRKKTEAHNRKLHEATAPGAENWVKNNKERFKKRYGKDWEKYLYAHAWNLRKANNNKLPRNFGKKKKLNEMMGLGKSRSRVSAIRKPKKISVKKKISQNRFAGKIRMVDGLAKSIL